MAGWLLDDLSHYLIQDHQHLMNLPRAHIQGRHKPQGIGAWGVQDQARIQRGPYNCTAGWLDQIKGDEQAPAPDFPHAMLGGQYFQAFGQMAAQGHHVIQESLRRPPVCLPC
jgi:hypothetical protein